MYMHTLGMLIYVKGDSMCLCHPIHKKKKKGSKIVKKLLSDVGA